MDNLIQQDALARSEALNPTKSFIVQAPAGSGKTELLTQRYLALLQHAQRAPEEIVAVTFTRKAQAEMRHRIMSALQRAQGEPPEEAHHLTTYQLASNVLARSDEQGWDLLKNPNRLRVMTIDALAHHLVHRLPILAQFGSSPNLSSQPQSLYKQAIENFLHSCQRDEKHQSFLKDLLWHLDNGRTKLENLLSQLLSKRDQWLQHVYPFSQNPEEGLDYLQDAMHRVIQKALSKAGLSIDESLKQNLMFYIQKAAENAEHLPKRLMGLSEIEFFPGESLEDLKHWHTLAHWLLTEKGDIRKKITKAQGFVAPSSVKCKETKEELKQIKQAFESILEHLREEGFADTLAPLVHLPDLSLSEDEHRILRSLFELLPLVVAHLKVVFKEKGEVDFIEVAEAALSALGDEDNPTDLALSLDYQMSHILIDEFQDTSIIQFQLFEKLIAGWGHEDGRTLFLVGDPQQSIYRFRGAEVGLFLRAKQQGMGDIDLEFLQLRRNFRSQAHLVDWSNQVFADIFPLEADIALGAVPLSESIAHHESAEGEVAIWGFGDKLQECSAIAQYLEDHKNDGQSKAILVRARNHLQQLIPLLKALKVPFEANEIETIASSMVIIDLLSLTKAMTDFSHRLSWMSVLRAPWCGLSIKDIWLLAKDDSSPILYENLLDAELLQPLSEEGKIKLNRFMHTVKPFIAQTHRQQLSETIKALWHQLGGPASYVEETLSKSSVFFDTLREYSAGGQIKDWEGFEGTVYKQFARQPCQSISAVQLMTIHKSKGLEFDTVFLPFLEKRPRKSDVELLLWQELPHDQGIDLLMAPAKGPDLSEDKLYHYLQRHISKKDALECSRLLYVGATRAKTNLFLTATFDFDDEGQIKKPSQSSFMGQLHPIIESKLRMIDNEAISVQADEKVTTLSSQWQLPQAINSLIRRDDIEKIEVIDEAKESGDIDKGHDLNRPDIVTNFEPQVGTLVHRILEMIAMDGLNEWRDVDLKALMPSWQKALIELNVSEDHRAFSEGVILSAIENTLSDEKGQWILKSHIEAACEYELVYWQNKKMHKAIIDRTFIDDEGRRWIIDYKTVFKDNPEPEEYQGQLMHYAKLFKRMEQREIMLGLYFPYQKIWWEGSFHSMQPIVDTAVE